MTRVRWTVRARLTLLYGLLFLASSAALLGVTYTLLDHRAGDALFGAKERIVIPWLDSPAPPPDLPFPGPSGPPTPDQVERQASVAHSTQMHGFLVNSAIGLGIMTLVSIWLGWLVAGRILRPLRTITRSVRHISATNLDRRLALTGPDDELKELGDTFDDLLVRLEASFRSQRQFVANASHELRTPLARQRTLIQVALTDPDATADSLRTVHERVLVANRQQEQLIEALLTIAQGEAGTARQEPMDLATVTGHVLLLLEPEAARLGLTLTATLRPAAARGNPHLVERLVTNLVENALRHNTPAGQVEVGTDTSGGYAVVSVSNTGPVVPESEIARLFQPFQRLGASRTRHDGGLGLGLSIVQAVATTHHATITATPRPTGGLLITVAFSLDGFRPA